MQAQRHGGRLDRIGRMAVVLLRQFVEHELVGAAALPQKIGIQFTGDRIGGIHEAAHGRFLETQQHVAGLDLGALAMRRFHLQRGGVVSHDVRHLDGAIFFVQYVHLCHFKNKGFTAKTPRSRESSQLSALHLGVFAV